MPVPLQPATQPSLDAKDTGLRMEQSPATKGHRQPASMSACNAGPASLTLLPGSAQEAWPGLRDFAFLLATEAAALAGRLAEA